MLWIDKKRIPLRKLFSKTLLPLAKQGLKELEIDSHDIEKLTSKTLKDRVISGQTGAEWQKKYMKKNKVSFEIMLEKYMKYQAMDIRYLNGRFKG